MFRIYIQQGCSHCDEVITTFRAAHTPFETIDVKNDPVVTAGLRAVTGQLVFPTPVIVCFIPPGVIVGNNTEVIKRAIDSCRQLSPNSLNTVTPRG